MSFPLNLHVGKVVINTHLIFELAAYTVGFQYYLYLKKKHVESLSYDDRIWILIGAGMGALIASRVLGYLAFPVVSPKSFLEFVLIWLSAKSILGGLLGGVIGVEVTKKIMGIKISTGDLFVYPIILAMMIGRLGCFSQGVFDGTHGTISSFPWALNMGDGLRRHPTQLYEIIFLAIVWILLKRIENNLVDGGKFKVFMISYLVYRFCVEWIKPVYFYYDLISAGQVACVLGFLYYFREILQPQILIKSRGEIHG